ncbi:hypothetical protein CKO28_25785 [Rhodovibrio sodomensis]|uniref:AAA+ ATPase domain-containing protein n=1 Tax=Rhodovibrio sodomensis TaxID=1088 RepID=A0ABS1DLK3_9PROT|nr:AAA family ATPase [Rhodovibrio sodomensis]MBK1671416.1 hypothetical protein [Rhodovibrio sodomensis]
MDELRWWRRRKPRALTWNDLDSLHRQLIAVTPTETNPGLARLVREAAGESGECAFKTALLLLRENPQTELCRDVIGSWLLLCARGPGTLQDRARDACRVLVDLHAQDVERLQVRGDRDAGDRVAALRHLAIARCHRPRLPSIVRTYQDDLRAAEVGRGPGEVAEDGAAQEPDDPPQDRPTMRVIRGEAIPGPRRLDDRRLIEEYEQLLGPLPLAGNPAMLPYLADQLETAFPWLSGFTAHLRDVLALRQYAGAGWLSLDPVVLVGPPGCGKTALARRLAELAGVGVDLLSLGGSSDARHLLGTARGWASAQPVGALVSIRRHGYANPVVVLDELDKSGGSDRSGRVEDALLAMIEPVSARRYYDECLNVELDLSAVNWIATANDLDRLPAMLKSRLTVIDAPAPDGSHLEVILAQIAADTAAELGTRPETLPALDAVTVAALRADLDRFGDVRRIARAYRRAVAVAVRRCPRPVDA